MILQAEKIGKHFTGGGLKEVDFVLNPGSFSVVSGESGIGKTTLLNILSGMLHPDEGRVLIDEKDLYGEIKKRDRISMLGKRIGYMMQGVSLIPSLTVYDNIVYPLRLTGYKADEKNVCEIFEKLGILRLRDSYPGRISGGEYRRVLLAGVLVKQPEVIIADEPTSNLDSETAAVVRSILYEYVTPATTVIVATHDEGFDRADNEINLS